jgi:hypothetical protein
MNGPKKLQFFGLVLCLLVRLEAYPTVDHLKGASLVKVLTRLEKLARNKQSSFLGPFIGYKKLSVVNMTPGACTVKHHYSVIYRKMTNFVVSEYLLAWTNTLASTQRYTVAYYGVPTLRIRNVFIEQAPGTNPMKKFWSTFTHFLQEIYNLKHLFLF